RAGGRRRQRGGGEPARGAPPERGLRARARGRGAPPGGRRGARPGCALVNSAEASSPTEPPPVPELVAPAELPLAVAAALWAGAGALAFAAVPCVVALVTGELDDVLAVLA